jgi:hypothetical protein
MPSVLIRASVFASPVDEALHGPPHEGPGKRFVFSHDLQLDEFDGQPQSHQHVGTYSGVATVLREPAANDNFYRNGGVLAQYESTYKFEAVGPVQAGDITEHGVVLFDSNLRIVGAKEFAITGGTGPYALARGSITAPGEAGIDSTTRLFNIQL